MHYALSYQVVEGFAEKRTPYRGDHLARICEARDRGDLVMAGALVEPSDGALLIFRGHGPEVAEQFAKTDPYVTGGLVRSWQVRKWMTVVGDGAVMPALPPA